MEELKDKKGLFVIEMLGNGHLSRAIIKKGSLSLIYRSLSMCQVCFIIDENQKVVSSDDDTTGMWIDDKFYESIKKENGAIYIPYTSESNLSRNVILVHENQSELFENFERQQEKYDFDCYFHLNQESLLMGQEASILVRPVLKINGRKISTDLLKNCKVELNMVNFIDRSCSKKVFDDIKFSDLEETIINFMVPPNLMKIDVKVTCERQNIAFEKMDKFYKDHTFEVSEHSQKEEV